MAKQVKKTNTKLNASKKKRKIVLLSTLIPLGVAGAAVGTYFGITLSKKNNNKVDVDVEGDDKGNVEVTAVKTASGNVEITITSKEESKEFKGVTEVYIGNTLLKEGEYEIKDNKIIIKKEVIEKNQGKILVKPTLEEKTVTGIKISVNQKQLKVDETFNISATVIYANNEDTIQWSIDAGGESIISIDKTTSLSGKTIQVTALKAGTAKLIAKSIKNPEKTASCQFTVIEKSVSGIRISKKQESVAVAKSFKTSATLTYSNADAINWSQTSSDNGKVEFDTTTTGSGEEVTVTGVSEGTVKITAKYNEEIYDSFVVTVTPETKPKVTDFTSVSFTGEEGIEAQASTGEAFTPNKLTVTGCLDGGEQQILTIGTHYTVVYNGNNITDAIVAGTYKFPDTEGEFKFTVKGTNGSTAQPITTAVNVVSTEKKIELNPKSALLDYYEDVTITATQTGLTGEINWSSNSEDVVLSSTTGTSIKVTAKNTECTAIISATSAQDPTVSATCTITVQHQEPVSYKTVTLIPDPDEFEGQLIPLKEPIEPQTITNDPEGTAKASWAFKDGFFNDRDQKFKFEISTTSGSITKEVWVPYQATAFEVEFNESEWEQLDDGDEITIKPVYEYKSCPISTTTNFNKYFSNTSFSPNTIKENDDGTLIEITTSPTAEFKAGTAFIATKTEPTIRIVETDIPASIYSPYIFTMDITHSMWATIGYDDELILDYEESATKEVTIEGADSITQGTSETYTATYDGQEIECTWSIEGLPEDQSVILDENQIKVRQIADPSQTYTLVATPTDPEYTAAEKTISITQCGPEVQLQSGQTWVAVTEEGSQISAPRYYYNPNDENALLLGATVDDVEANTFEVTYHPYGQSDVKLICGTDGDFELAAPTGNTIFIEWHINQITEFSTNDTISINVLPFKQVTLDYDQDSFTDAGLPGINVDESSTIIDDTTLAKKTISIAFASAVETDVKGSIVLYDEDEYEVWRTENPITIESGTNVQPVIVDNWDNITNKTQLTVTFEPYVKEIQINTDEIDALFDGTTWGGTTERTFTFNLRLMEPEEGEDPTTGRYQFHILNEDGDQIGQTDSLFYDFDDYVTSREIKFEINETPWGYLESGDTIYIEVIKIQ